MSKNKSKLRIANEKYWTDRNTKLYLAGEKEVIQVAKHLGTLYKQTSKIIEDQIAAFYGKYAKERSITYDEAKALLDKSELKDFRAYIEKMLAMGNKKNFSSAEMREFRRLYNKARITRLEELEANIRGELDKLAVKTVNNVDDMLNDTYEDTYYHNIYNLGYTGSFSGLNTRAVEKAVSEKYSASNYSLKTPDYQQGIWDSTSKLMGILNKEIPKGIVLGYNPRKLAREVTTKRVNKTLYNNTVRLMRTEYSHIFNQATLDSYKEVGVKQYQILTTLDSRTCDDCSAYEGKIVDTSDMMEGVNIPPFHPNCRCTTIPYFEEDEIDEMSDEELDNIDYVSYEDWKDGLVKLDNGQVIYKQKINPIKLENAKTINNQANKSNIEETKIFISESENKELIEYYIKMFKKEKNRYAKWVKELPNDTSIKIKQDYITAYEESTKAYDKMVKLAEKGFKDEIINLSSISGCKKLLSKINCELTVNLTDYSVDLLDKNLVAETSKEFYTTIRRNPVLMEGTVDGFKLEFTNNDEHFNENKNSIGYTSNEGICINASYYTNYYKFKELALKQQNDGWWMRTDEQNATKSIITHELGHLLLNTSGEKADYIGIAIQRTMEKYNLTKKQVIDKYVCQYGKTNSDEMFAELFTGSQLGEGNELTKEFIKCLKEKGVWKK